MLNEKANFTNFTEDKVHQEMSKSHLDLEAAVRIGRTAVCSMELAGVFKLPILEGSNNANIW